MNQYHFSAVQRCASFGLALLLTVGLAAPAMAAAPAAACDETYYATLDYYGALTDSSIVKTYRTYGSTAITDYGSYDTVTNLTDSRVPKIENGKVTFDFVGDVPEKFYFEGKTAQPYDEFPWTLDVSYTLNGVPAKAEDLAGKSGVVEIILTALPNEKASEYNRNNLVLTAISAFNGDDILSLEAPGAQVQMLGNLYCVLNAVLPGERRECVIRVGTEEFSYSGMMFLAVPATLGQLDQITALREAEDELGDSYRTIADNMDVILGSLENMNGSLNTAANGLDRLNQGREVISGGKEQVYENLDIALDAAGPLTEVMKSAGEHLETARKALAEGTALLNTVDEDLDRLWSEADSARRSLIRLRDQVSGNGKDSLKEISRDMTVHLEALNAINTSLNDLEDQLAGLDTDPSGKTILIQGKTVAEIKTLLSQAETLHQSYEGVSQQMPGLSFQDFTAYYLIFKATGGTDEAFPTFLMTQAPGLDLTDPTYQQAVANAAQLAGLLETSRQPGFSEQLTQAETLQTLLARYDMTLEQMKDTLKDASGILTILSPLCQDLEHLMNTLSASDGVLTTTGDLTDVGIGLLTELDTAEQRLDEMIDLLNRYSPKAQTALKDAQTLADSASNGLTALVDAARTGEGLLKSSGPSLDEGTRETLSGTAAALRSASAGLGRTANIRGALQNIDGVITGEWDRFTGEENNLLLMDPAAPAQSITDSRNEGTASIQYVMRTQEIKAVQESPAAEKTDVKPDAGSFWDRVKTMFRDLWHGLTGIF